MSVSVVVPPESGGRVTDGLRARGAGFQLISEEVLGTGTMTISTRAPLSQMFGYARDLRARTVRHGTLTMKFSHYAPAILNL
jgi:elongation factor G